MGTLYVVGLEASTPDDITLRARRILREVGLVVSAEPDRAVAILESLGQPRPVLPLTTTEPTPALQAGDVGLLHVGPDLLPGAEARAWIDAALEHGVPVVPIPGSSLPLTALVVSGLPADSFLYLGPLSRPGLSFSRLAGLAQTVIALESPERLLTSLAELDAALGDRPLALAGEYEGWPADVWRGRLSTAAGHLAEHRPRAGCVLVVGGAIQTAAEWDEERLHAEIRARLARGQPARDIARELAAASGWPRRHIYRLAVDLSAA